ncbi:MAG: hypothetical protein IT385_17790 [Deltaproteobacteria bacterium]|nr:hypothetical protein [Deltaproteobacteria bacterium]
MDEGLPEHWVDRAAATTGAERPLPTRGWLADAVALAEALFATEAGPPPRDHLAWLAHELDDYVAHLGGRSRLIVRGSFLAIAGLAPLASGRLRPLSRLTVHERQRLLERLERSPLALSVLAVRASLCILWYEHPDHAREVGLRPRPRPPRAWPDAGGAT